MSQCTCDQQESSFKKAKHYQLLLRFKMKTVVHYVAAFPLQQHVFFPINLSTALKIIYPYSKVFDVFMAS